MSEKYNDNETWFLNVLILLAVLLTGSSVLLISILMMFILHIRKINLKIPLAIGCSILLLYLLFNKQAFGEFFYKNLSIFLSFFQFLRCGKLKTIDVINFNFLALTTGFSFLVATYFTYRINKRNAMAKVGVHTFDTAIPKEKES